MIPDINRKIDILVSRLIAQPVPEKEEVKVNHVPKNFISVKDFCDKYKFVSLNTVLRMVQRIGFDPDKFARVKQNNKKFYIDPVYFLHYFLSNNKSKELAKRYSCFLLLDESLISLRTQVKKTYGH